MSDLNRRGFLKSVATLPILGASAALPAAAQQAQAPQLDPALLLALAQAVLPSELGAAGHRRAAQDFERWLAQYEPTAEINHGYGTDEIEFLPAHPGPGWRAQLTALDLEATNRTGQPFAKLDIAARREIVSRQLGEERSLPTPHQARHVALGLLAWWCATPDATDRAYRARIGKETCRALAQSPRKPAPIPGLGS
jgi:hypothetical protein